MSRNRRQPRRESPPRQHQPPVRTPPRRIEPREPGKFTPNSQGGTQLGGGPGLLGIPQDTMLASAEDFGDSNGAIQDFLKGGGSLA
jgi:hypothetical protein